MGETNPWIVWAVIPLLIFMARIVDVSIGTLRIILVGKGFRLAASILGFLESLFWVTAAAQIMQNLDKFYYFFAYAGGFACGTYVGMKIDTKLSIGQVVVRIITKFDASELIKHLEEHDYHLTVIDADASLDRKVKVIFLTLKRSMIEETIETIKYYNPNAVYTIEDLRYASEGYFPRSKRSSALGVNQLKKAFGIRK